MQDQDEEKKSLSLTLTYYYRVNTYWYPVSSNNDANFINK